MYTYIKDRPDMETRIEDLFLRDAQGRKIGVRIQTFKAIFALLPFDQTGGYKKSPGVYYASHVQATRNDQIFGKTAQVHYAYNPTEREAHVLREVTEVKSQMLKEYGWKGLA